MIDAISRLQVRRNEARRGIRLCRGKVSMHGGVANFIEEGSIQWASGFKEKERDEPNDMRVLFEDGLQAMRMIYYPPCPEPEIAIGLCAHSDPIGLTILLQINEMEGLQVKKDGAWVPIKPLQNAFVVNVGDIMEIVSNGVYPSIEHRATVNSVKERLSIATVYSPRLDGDVGPAPSLISPENPPLFRRIGVADYFKNLYTRELHGKAYLDFLRVQPEEIIKS
ncbi:codeine O-demethylase-like [Hibiscus syriacus]|uniref:codeine O-demethylase-like n=1 Tax=Hibiscus syriacus TaxID=106335 RepID=UPI0019211626|nr:codeine O-demethylase-like [Hibiscus syriacus]